MTAREYDISVVPNFREEEAHRGSPTTELYARKWSKFDSIWIIHEQWQCCQRPFAIPNSSLDMENEEFPYENF